MSLEKELTKSEIDINNIQEKQFEDIIDDYIVNDKGEVVIRVSPLEYILIEEIKLLKERIKTLEGVK